MVRQFEISVQTRGKGLYPITRDIAGAVRGHLPPRGLLNVFIEHTSASLTIQENADPSARRDLEAFLERLVPEGERYYEHTAEGPDDTTSHIKSVYSG